MSSNRLISLLKQAFTDSSIANKCKETSKSRITNKDCSRIFDDFPKLLNDNDPRVQKLAQKLNIVLAQIHNHYQYKESFRPAEDGLNQWLIQIAIMAKQELLDSEGYIKTELINLLEWNKLCLQIDIHQLIRAYLSVVLPQIIQVSLNSFKGCPPEYTAIVCSHASSNSSKCIAQALENDDNNIELSTILIPAGIVTLALIGGLLKWSLSSDSSKEEKKLPEKKAGNY